jgi:hypothetical protein
VGLRVTMPLLQKLTKGNSLLNQKQRRLKAINYSCTESSNGSLSDDSEDALHKRQFRHATNVRTELPIGTLVKKVSYE